MRDDCATCEEFDETPDLLGVLRREQEIVETVTRAFGDAVRATMRDRDDES
jgi:hypothetical protein